jgi:hypothetical protein
MDRDASGSVTPRLKRRNALREPIIPGRSLRILVVMAVSALSLIYAYWVTRSLALTVVAGLWCAVCILVPAILYRRLMREGRVAPPKRKWMVRIYGGLTLYTLGLAGLEYWTGDSPQLWLWTVVAAAAFLVAALASRREFT